MKCRFQNKKPLDSQRENQGALPTISGFERKATVNLQVSPETRLILLALLLLYSRSLKKKSPSVLQTRFPDFRLELYQCFTSLPRFYRKRVTACESRENQDKLLVHSGGNRAGF